MTTTAAIWLLAGVAIPVTAVIAVLRARIDQFADRVNRTFREGE